MAPDRKVLQAAASWYVQFQAEPGNPEQRLAWQRWLASDPAHQQAWKQMEQLQRSLGALPGDVTQRALSATQRRRQVLKLVVLLAAGGGVGWNLKEHSSLWTDYRTGTGERRRIELTDGSQLDMNTDTALDVRFDEHQRLIHLRGGEILIATAKRNDPRPLRVQTAQGVVEALGTRFSVRQLSDTTHVGVLQDRVRVEPRDPVDKPVLLSSGQSADFDTHRILHEGTYRLTQVAWVDGQLIVLDTRLGDVIDELARYRPGVMQCDERAANLKVSGTFRLDATEAVLANLQATLPIKVRYFTRYWVSVSRMG